MHSRPLNQRPLWHRLLEWAGTLGFVGQAVWFGSRIYGALDSLVGALSILLGILLGYLVADLLSGIAHWVGDRFFDPTTPILGPSFIAPFREHHLTPQAMVEHGPIELVGNSALLALPTLVAAHHLFDLERGSAWGLFLASLVLSSLVAAVLTNLFHRWAHMTRPPRLARRLQGLGLIISPEHHAGHHRGAYDRSYCITTGWLNRPLDRLEVWSRLEGLFGRGEESVRSVTRRPG